MTPAPILLSNRTVHLRNAAGNDQVAELESADLPLGQPI